MHAHNGMISQSANSNCIVTVFVKLLDSGNKHCWKSVLLKDFFIDDYDVTFNCSGECF